jgi:hypothetical protein
MTKFVAIFPDGQRAERVSDAAYTHASRDAFGRVRFHASEFSAPRTAIVVPVEDSAPASACIVCDGERIVRYGPSAVDGSFSTVPCHRCS